MLSWSAMDKFIFLYLAYPHNSVRYLRTYEINCMVSIMYVIIYIIIHKAQVF
jgi:hypothetical protein